MTTDWKALCAELLAWAEKTSSNYYNQADVLLRARAALDEQEVWEGPPAVTTGAWLHPAYEPGDGSADGAQMVELAWWHPQFGCDSLQMVVDNARAILARWGNPAPQPVPVSERLPGPEDCDVEGRCWLWERYCGYSGCKWALVDRTWSLSQSDEDLSVYTHWLPFHALPLPEQEVSE